MKLITVLGFPRTGTTWVLRTLATSPDVAGPVAELGWSKLWDLYRDVRFVQVGQQFSRYSLKSADLERDAFLWGGFYLGEWIAMNGVAGAFDAMARPYIRRNHRAFAEKTPILGRYPADWPTGYLAKSRVFTDAAVIVCQRDFAETRASALNHYGPRIEQQFPQDRFEEYYDRFYEDAARRDNVLWLQHAETADKPEETARAIWKFCGVQAGTPVPWTQKTG